MDDLYRRLKALFDRLEADNGCLSYSIHSLREVYKFVEAENLSLTERVFSLETSLKESAKEIAKDVKENTRLREALEMAIQDLRTAYGSRDKIGAVARARAALAVAGQVLCADCGCDDPREETCGALVCDECYQKRRRGESTKEECHPKCGVDDPINGKLICASCQGFIERCNEIESVQPAPRERLLRSLISDVVTEVAAFEALHRPENCVIADEFRFIRHMLVDGVIASTPNSRAKNEQ